MIEGTSPSMIANLVSTPISITDFSVNPITMTDATFSTMPGSPTFMTIGTYTFGAEDSAGVGTGIGDGKRTP
jgi:hypothetical protein